MAFALNYRLEVCVWLHVLHLLMQFDSLLESVSLVPHIFIFNRDHSIVHVSAEITLFRRFLVVEARIAGTEWIPLIALAYLEGQSPHLVFHELIVKITARAWVLADLL